MACKLLSLVLLSSTVHAADCAKDLHSLGKLFGEENFPAVWRETTANDGKPLVVTLSERKGQLHLEFNKTKEGLWAAGTAGLCKGKDGVEAKITKKQIKLGKAAPWILRMSMKGGATFKLSKKDAATLHIGTFGWSGDFVPEEKKNPAVSGVLMVP